jgi:hypothetical protein
MNRDTVSDPAEVQPAPVSVPSSGAPLLHDPSFNKGTAFTEVERDRLHLRGLLPPRILTLEQQLDKTLASFRSKPTDLERYIYLISLQDRNERLFGRSRPSRWVRATCCSSARAKRGPGSANWSWQR